MRQTATLVLMTALFGLLAAPAAADHRLSPRLEREIEKAEQERDHRLYKLDAAMEGELRRAERKYAGNRRGLEDARVRLDHWYDQHKCAIENDFRYRVARARAEARRSPVDRDLALAEAERDHRIGKLDIEMADETYRAERKYCDDAYGLSAAKRRLDLWYRKHSSSIHADFRAKRAEILACRW
mgnify:CR=1 FL=1